MPSHNSAVQRFGRIASVLPVVFGAMLLMAVLLKLTGRDPVATFCAVFSGGFGTPAALQYTLVRTIPVFLCALAVAIPAKAGVLNIGGEGQLHVGAIAATLVVLLCTGLPHLAVVPCMILVAILGGAFWSAVPGLLKGWLQVNEVLVGLMMNYVAILAVEYLVHGPWRDPGALGWPYTSKFPSWAVLPTVRHTDVHLGLLLGVLLAVITYFALKHTSWGQSSRVIEASPPTANYAGIALSRYVVALMAVGGAAAAIAGLGEVSVIQGRLRPGMSPGYGYSGLLVAWLGKNNPLAIIPISFVVGGLYTGADALQLTAGLPSSAVDVFIGVTFLSVLVGEYARGNKGRQATAEA